MASVCDQDDVGPSPEYSRPQQECQQSSERAIASYGDGERKLSRSRTWQRIAQGEEVGKRRRINPFELVDESSAEDHDMDSRATKRREAEIPVVTDGLSKTS